jgi:hypothetical protein
VRGGDLNKLLVRGCHPCFYPVDLPDWLPLDVMTEMLDVFGRYLYPELAVAIGGIDGTGHKQKSSNASMRSDMSVTSATSLMDVPRPPPDPTSMIL